MCMRDKIKLAYVGADVPQRFDELKVDGRVCGIAQLDDEIFITTSSSPSISVFCFRGRQNFDKREDVSIHDSVEALKDITASGEFQHLFVADSGNRCVWQLEKSSWGQGWTAKDRAVSKVDPVSLSVNARRLLVVERRRLTVVVVGEKKLKPTALPGNLEAEHALETSHGTFVVCGRVAEKPGVVEVNIRGALQRVCDSQSLGFPGYLSTFGTDEKEETFLVADFGTSRVVLLNSELQVVRVLLDEVNDHVRQPCRVLASGRLLVGYAERSDDYDNHRGTVGLYYPHKSKLQSLSDAQ